MTLCTVRNLKDPICDRADFNADICPGKFITIYGQSGRRATDANGQFSKRFNVGDRAEYDSYNLRYTGIIVAIGEKTVTVNDNDLGERRRLNLVEFIRRNWDFDGARIDAENDAERICL